MSGALWHFTLLPLDRLIAHLKFDDTALDHDAIVEEPVLLPGIAVDFNRLDIEAAMTQRDRAAVTPVARRGDDAKRAVPVNGDVNVGEPGRRQQVQGLRHHGVQPQHLPHQPRVQGARVAVAGDPVQGVVEVLVRELARLIDGFPLLV